MPHLPKNFIAGTIIILHLVGAVCTVIPLTAELVKPLTPINLLLSTILLVAAHHGSYKLLGWFFLCSFLIGFSIEAIGVATGFPFGIYQYGATLGMQVLEVPLIIGVNWFLLAYAFGMIMNQTDLPPVIKIPGAALGMTALDFIIEPVAIALDYWQWEHAHVPLTNYLSWFVIALVIQSIFHRFLSGENNHLSLILILSQIFYFLFVHILFNI